MPSPSWMQMEGIGGRTPFHLLVTPPSMAAFTAASMAALAAVLLLGTSTVTENLGSAGVVRGGLGLEHVAIGQSALTDGNGSRVHVTYFLSSLRHEGPLRPSIGHSSI